MWQFNTYMLKMRPLMENTMGGRCVDTLEATSKCYAVSFRRHRKLKKLTQEQAAERAGISPQYVSKIERGMCSPSLEVSTRLAEALGVKLATIVDIGDPEEYLYEFVMVDAFG